MSTIDIVIALILAIGGYLGYKRGFLMELFYLLALVLGVFLGFKLMGKGMQILHEQFNADQTFLPYLAFIIIFVLVILLVIFLGQRVKNSVDQTFLGKVDAIAGAALGVIKYSFCLSIIIWLAQSLKIELPQNWMEDSRLYPFTAKVAERTSSFLGQFIPFFKEIFRQF
ncbi:MAG: CvpA family protein [Cyclobacteriaceae bacterium]|nr:CvpA family protein [Flammeovirgaceae bacterium]